MQRLLQRVYVEGATTDKGVPTEGVPALLKQARPVREFVKVDLCLPGCPPPSKSIAGVIAAVLAARKPDANMTVKFG